MFFTEASAAVVDEIVEADAGLNCIASDMNSQEAERKPRPGAFVITKDGGKKYLTNAHGGHLDDAIVQGKAVYEPEKEVVHQGQAVKTPMFQFPNSQHYRWAASPVPALPPNTYRRLARSDRTLLSVLDAAISRAGLTGTFHIVSYGDRLLNEGVTLKTRDHTRDPTARARARRQVPQA